TATEKDRHELGKDLPRIAEIRVWMHEKTGKLLCTVQNGDGGEFAHYVRTPDGKRWKISGFADKIVQATCDPAGDLFLISRQAGPRAQATARLHGLRSLPDGRRRLPVRQRVVPRTARAIPLQGRHSPDGENTSYISLAGQLRRREGGARVRHEQGRHQGPRQ